MLNGGIDGTLIQAFGWTFAASMVGWTVVLYLMNWIDSRNKAKALRESLIVAFGLAFSSALTRVFPIAGAVAFAVAFVVIIGLGILRNRRKHEPSQPHN